MGKERCWKCKKMKNGVTLRACDDRLCEQCFLENEALLKAIQLSDNKTSGDTCATHSSTITIDGPSQSMDLTHTTDIPCDICCESICISGLHYPTDVVNKLLSIVDITGWVCPACRTDTKLKLAAKVEAMSELKDTVDNIQHDIQMIKSVIQTTTHDATVRSEPVIWPSNTDAAASKTRVKFVAAVRADFENSLKRKSNVIVHGLKSDSNADDVQLFLELCEEHLQTKPYVIKEKCRRLGVAVTGKVQPLLIALSNESAANDILNDAKRLRMCSEEYVRQSVYVNPDLTPAQAQLAYDRRQKRRQRKEMQMQSNENASNFNPSSHQTVADLNNTSTKSLFVSTDTAPTLNYLVNSVDNSVVPPVPGDCVS